MLSDKVKVLATTATATMETLEAVKDRLAMHEPAIVSLPPDKENIRFTVVEKPEFKKELHTLIAELTREALNISQDPRLLPDIHRLCHHVPNCTIQHGCTVH